MNIRKIIPVVLVIALAGLALAACMNNDSANVQPTPGATADYSPNTAGGAQSGNGGAQNGSGAAQSGSGAAGMTQSGNDAGSGATGNTAATSNGALNPFDWANGASNVEKSLSRISEIADARVVVTNTTALVGVQFDNAYKGEMTERIREMVAAEVLKADPGIQTVAVTSSDADVKKIYDLSEQIRAGRTADELSAEINSIVRSATTMR